MSPNQNLVVTAYQVITNLNMTGPSSPQAPGAVLTVPYTYLNSGGDGDTTFTLKDELGATLATQTRATPAGSGSGSLTFTMLNKDTTLTLTTNYGGSASRVIQVLRAVSTTLSLMLTPTNPRVSTPVVASGVLSRNDDPANYNGVASVTVQLLDSAGAVVGTGTTTSTGGYSITFNAPPTPGTYTYHTYFAGSGLLSSALSRSLTLNFGGGALLPLAALTATALWVLFK